MLCKRGGNDIDGMLILKYEILHWGLKKTMYDLSALVLFLMTKNDSI